MPSPASPAETSPVSSAETSLADLCPQGRLLSEWSRDAVLVALCVAALIVARAVLLASLWSYAGPLATSGGVVTAMLRGFPFDVRTATIVLLPTLVFSLTAVRWPWSTARRILRTVLGSMFLTLLLLLTLVDHYYFIEYANQFDHFVIGIIYDDTSAILRTVWQKYPVCWGVAAVVLFAAGCACGLSRFCHWQPFRRALSLRRSLLTDILLTIAILAIIIVSARGSLSRLPAQSKNVAVTPDDKLLNKMVLNPVACMKGAWTDFRDKRADGSAHTAEEARAAAQRLSGNPAELATLNAYFARTAHGAAATPPKHIVLLLMESYSAWAMADRYQALGLAEHLRDLAVRGVSCPRFLSEGSGTICSVGPLLTGLPDGGPMQSYQPLARAPFATSLAPTFRRLGYRTRFFYSGYLSWQRLGDFVDGQGFDEVNGGGVISDWTSGNEWGVDDAQLLTYVADHQVDAVPTLDVVLTTSNHPPFSVDVFGRGFPHRTMPDALRGLADDTADLSILGHLWFADRSLGEFVQRVERAQPDTLFVITGDHYGRRFLNRSPDPWERTAVPAVFYGPAVAGRQLQAAAGSHLDLIPTLVELCANVGFTYHAIGVDLFTQAQVAAQSRVGGLSATGAVDWNNRSDASGITPEELRRWQQISDDRATIGWWGLMKGPGLNR